jgi:hypothetical protein
MILWLTNTKHKLRYRDIYLRFQFDSILRVKPFLGVNYHKNRYYINFVLYLTFDLSYFEFYHVFSEEILRINLFDIILIKEFLSQRFILLEKYCKIQSLVLKV